jgi:hypothetical protein
MLPVSALLRTCSVSAWSVSAVTVRQTSPWRMRWLEAVPCANHIEAADAGPVTA